MLNEIARQRYDIYEFAYMKLIEKANYRNRKINGCLGPGVGRRIDCK